MAQSGDGRYVRVAEGVYRRNGSYYVPIYYGERPDTGKPGKLWHGPGAKACKDLACRHVAIVDLRSAKQAKRELEGEKKARGRGAPTVKTIREWGARRADGGQWLSLWPRKEEGTMVHNEERVGRFLLWLDEEGPNLKPPISSSSPLAAVTEEVALLFFQAYPRASPSREVRTMFEDAVKTKLLAVNPFSVVTWERSRGRRDIKVLTLDELDELLALARSTIPEYGERFALMLEIAAWTGVRPGELYLLSFKDDTDARVNFVDFAHRCIHVEWAYKKTGVGRPKYESQRKVAMLPPAETAFRRLLEHVEGKDEDGMCFLTPRGSRFTTKNQFYYWDKVRVAFTASRPANHWLRRRIEEDPKGGDLDMYELRHFFGTALAQPPWAGIRPASQFEIATQMGHKDNGALAMEVYIHTDPERANNEILAAWAHREDAPVAEGAGGA